MFIRLILFAMLLAAFLLPSCDLRPPVGKGTASLRPSPYPTVWYDSLSGALDTYVAMGRSLHRQDTVQANAEAGLLRAQLDRLPKTALGKHADSLERVETILGSMQAELEGFQGEDLLDGKRDEYHMITELWYDLVLLTGLKNRILYRMEDSTARYDQGGSWLAATLDSADNPYNAQTVQRSITDTLRFR